MVPLHLFVASLLGWLQCEQHKVVKYLREENRVLKAQLRNQRVQLTDDERRRLAVLGASLGRRILAEVATIVTPDTILRRHRELIARKWTYPKRRPGRPAMLPTIRRLVVRMATENPRWGYTRIQGALKNLGHRVARSTIATILKEQGIPPSEERATSWQTFLRAHWGAVVAADFFTTEVWTLRGLVTYYTVFVIELHTRGASISSARRRTRTRPSCSRSSVSSPTRPTAYPSESIGPGARKPQPRARHVLSHRAALPVVFS